MPTPHGPAGQRKERPLRRQPRPPRQHPRRPRALGPGPEPRPSVLQGVGTCPHLRPETLQARSPVCVWGGERQKGPERLEPQLLGLSTPPIAACLSGQGCPEPGGDACASAELPQHMLTASQGLTHSNLNAPISQRRKLRRRRAQHRPPAPGPLPPPRRGQVRLRGTALISRPGQNSASQAALGLPRGASSSNPQAQGCSASPQRRSAEGGIGKGEGPEPSTAPGRPRTTSPADDGRWWPCPLAPVSRQRQVC